MSAGIRRRSSSRKLRGKLSRSGEPTPSVSVGKAAMLRALRRVSGGEDGRAGPERSRRAPPGIDRGRFSSKPKGRTPASRASTSRNRASAARVPSLDLAARASAACALGDDFDRPRGTVPKFGASNAAARGADPCMWAFGGARDIAPQPAKAGHAAPDAGEATQARALRDAGPAFGSMSLSRRGARAKASLRRAGGDRRDASRARARRGGSARGSCASSRARGWWRRR